MLSESAKVELAGMLGGHSSIRLAGGLLAISRGSGGDVDARVALAAIAYWRRMALAYDYCNLTWSEARALEEALPLALRPSEDPYQYKMVAKVESLWE